jgi:hypothetical protein
MNYVGYIITDAVKHANVFMVSLTRDNQIGFNRGNGLLFDFSRYEQLNIQYLIDINLRAKLVVI